ncbi:hypothetical protein [Nocardia huaxiensis]|uniref:hypothetical protein n=1 Tax=Nocardia huaxiensis TaxID=2755382 RepID=UPI001E2F11CB|nr:hypothetical protein [Nocardia huaxiensis]UFS97054.1 hypothetical protein LPY97_03720 [Nocardia huaxiensis]
MATLLGVAACGTDTDLPAVATTAAHLSPVTASNYEFPLEWAGDYTYRWTAATGIDLDTPEAKVVRAFAESTQLALSVGSRLAYPGYADAIPDDKGLRVPDGGAYPAGATEGDWESRWAGTFLATIMRIEPNATGFTAMYCVDDTNVADSFDAGATYTWRQHRPGEPPKGTPMWITVRSTSDVVSPRAEADQRSTAEGPARAPNYNVFAGWHVLDVWGPSPRSAEAGVLAEQCTAWTQANAHINPAYLVETPSRMSAAPPPEPAPPLPGWGTRIAG